MKIPSDTELQKIVERVLSQVRGGSLNIQEKKKSHLEQEIPETNIIALGADHGGYELKEILESYLSDQGYQIIDCGTHNKESVDYPDYAGAVAEQVAAGEAWRGVIIDGAGIGSCMTANKIKGVRAAMCYDHATAFNSREHNDANVLTLGAGMIGANLAKQITDTFLKTEFGGGRHARRVDKIMAYENNRN